MKLQTNGTLNRYLCNDELCDAIHTAHLSTGHIAVDLYFVNYLGNYPVKEVEDTEIYAP